MIQLFGDHNKIYRVFLVATTWCVLLKVLLLLLLSCVVVQVLERQSSFKFYLASSYNRRLLRLEESKPETSGKFR